MLVTKSTSQRFSIRLARLPSCIRTQEPLALFNFGLHCPLSDIRATVFSLRSCLAEACQETYALWQRIW